jgi:deoxyribose-phosphate aldolase
VFELASYIDHTILKQTTTHIDIKRICNECVEYHFAAACVPPTCVLETKELLAGASKVATVIGFPFGYSTGKAKQEEVEEAIRDGADELDVVINLIALKNGDWNYLAKEMNPLKQQIHTKGKVLKVIIESGVLNHEEIARCCELYGGMGVDYVKTSTGYAEQGASVEAVRLMRRYLPLTVKIKASGGIRNYAFALELIQAGADRLGCSAGVAIVREAASGNQAASY